MTPATCDPIHEGQRLRQRFPDHRWRARSQPISPPSPAASATATTASARTASSGFSRARRRHRRPPAQRRRLGGRNFRQRHALCRRLSVLRTAEETILIRTGAGMKTLHSDFAQRNRVTNSRLPWESRKWAGSCDRAGIPGSPRDPGVDGQPSFCRFRGRLSPTGSRGRRRDPAPSTFPKTESTSNWFVSIDKRSIRGALLRARSR